MNYFLLLVILGICGGAYYEHTVFEQTKIAEQHQIDDLTSQVEKLKSENKKLTDDMAQMAKSADPSKEAPTSVTAKPEAAAQPAGDAASTQATTDGGPAKASPPAAPGQPSNDLGTITEVGGKTYENCKLLKVDAEGITINHASGITKVMFAMMPPELQKRFGYDPLKAAALTEAQIQYQEQQRKAAGGN